MDKIVTIAVDFDGTLCEVGSYPKCGRPNKYLFNYLIRHKKAGGKVILWTCRCGKELEDAIAYCKDYGLEFDGINENIKEYIEKFGNDTRKIYADLYIDDRSANKHKFGIPYHAR